MLKTKRIYYGPNGGKPFWTVKVIPAKSPVTVRGTLMDVFKASRGDTMTCGIGQIIMRQGEAFGLDKGQVPYPVVTKSNLLVVAKYNAKGEPTHVYKWDHSFGKIIDANDEGTLPELAVSNPKLVERNLTFRVPRPPPKRKKGTVARKGTSRINKTVISVGAARRAAKAGLISSGLAQVFTAQEQKA